MSDRPAALNVMMNGEVVATLSEGRGQLRLAYSDTVLSEHRGKPLLSCCLPVASRPKDARPFFDGLLPEGRFRAELAATAGVVASDTYGFLARYGRDVAGAVSVVDPNTELSPDRAGVISLSTKDFQSEVEALPTRPLGIHDDSELSLPGLQNKMLLVRDGRSWSRPVGGYPSTHILKMDSQAHPGVVEAEAAAMKLAKAVGLTTVSVEVLSVGAISCIVVERFDRITGHGQVQRVHQEDMCQALGFPPERKYELPGRGRPGTGGGPEFVQVAELLDVFSDNAAADLDTLAQVAVFTALIGNSDAHGKNLSLLHAEPGSVRLAPLYDTVPTILFPGLKDEAAMTIGGTLNLADVRKATIAQEAKHWRVDPARMVSQGIDIAERVLQSTESVDHDGLRRLVTERAKAFLAS